MSKVAVFGGGSWGTAFATVLADGGNDVSIWARRPDLVAQINRGRNEDYLPDHELPQSISATTDPAEAADGAQVVVLNLAREIVQRQPAATVVACPDQGAADLVAAACATSYFRPYTSTDLVGAEVGGAVKNVIALAVGMAEGMGLGDNTKSSIITRGLAEMTRLGVALGADARTFAGLAGVGDLIATCMSPLSRNHSFGVGLGRGMSVAEVQEHTRQTAEGVKSCSSILDLARAHGVDVPIIEQVSACVHEGTSVPDVVHALLSRARKPETD